MKHFGAQLAGLNNEVDGNENSRLVIGTNDYSRHYDTQYNGWTNIRWITRWSSY